MSSSRHIFGDKRAEDGLRVRVAAFAAFALPFALYLRTLAPTVTLEDSGELLTVAHTLGVAHPPGYPLWSLLAHAFTWLPWGTVAERVHVSSAFFAAAASWLLFRVAHRATERWPAALAGALAFGFSGALWSQAVVAEVYALNAFLTLLVLDLALRFAQTRDPKWVFALAFTVGIGCTNHHLLALAAPAPVLWALAADARAVLKRPVLAGSAALFALGLSLYAYLPIRARANPPVNWDRPESLEQVLAHVRRDAYTSGARASGDAVDVLRHSFDALAQAVDALGWPLALLAVLGLALGRFPRGLRATTLAVFVLATFGLNAILRDRFVPLWSFDHRVYYIPAHAMAALWVALGFAVLERAVRATRIPAATLPVLTAAALALGVGVHWRENDRSGDRLAREFGLDFLAGVPQGAGLLPLNDSVLFPVLYLKYVEGLRPDVQILSPSFGWDGRPVSVVVSDTPVTDRFRRDFPQFAATEAAPSGLGWVLAGDRAPAPATDPLPRGFDPGAPEGRFDPFASEVRSYYAAYHARRGASLAKAGALDEARRAFDDAERLSPEDPYVAYLLATSFLDSGLRADRARELLERALATWDRTYEPSAMSLYPITRDDLRDALARARRD